MADELSWEAVLAWHLARQGLAERAPAENWLAVVARVCGLHAQVQSSAELTLWARVEGSTARRSSARCGRSAPSRRSRAGSGCRRPRRRAGLIAALGDEVAPVSVEGRDGWMLRDDVAQAAAARPHGTVALLPAFDAYVVAAPRDDSPVLAARHKARVYRPQGWLSPVLLVDGRIAGVWRHECRAGRVRVAIEPFDAVGDAVRAGAEREAWRLADHLGGELELAWSTPDDS